MVTDREDKWLDAMHGLDAARRVGWAKAYSYEEALAEANQKLEELEHSLIRLRITLSQAVGVDGKAATKADLIEAIMQTDPDLSWSVWWLHSTLGYEQGELEDTMDDNTDRFVRLNVEWVALKRWAD